MIRLLGNGLRIHFIQLSRSSNDMIAMTLWPILYATLAYYLFGAHSGPRVLFSASLGATVMAIWGSVTTRSSFSLGEERRYGTLELLVAAPVPFIAVLAPITIATGAIGIYALATTLLWGWLAFGIPVHLVHPFLFVVAMPAAVVAIGMLGLLIATTIVVYRAAGFLGNALEYPGWLLTGLLVPISILPAWIQPVSWILAPTWGMRAIRHAALGGNALPDIAVCLGLSLSYGLLALLSIRGFELLARRRATLALS
jgi:ABC-2 type transport system permease protein